MHGLQANKPELVHQRFQVVDDFGKFGLQLEIVFQDDDGLIVIDRPFPQGKVAGITADFPWRWIVATRVDRKKPVIDPPEPVGMPRSPLNCIEKFKLHTVIRHLFDRFGAPDLGRAQADDENLHMGTPLRRADYRGCKEIRAIGGIRPVLVPTPYRPFVDRSLAVNHNILKLLEKIICGTG